MLNKAGWRGLNQMVFFPGYLPCKRKKHDFMSVTDSPLKASLKIIVVFVRHKKETGEVVTGYCSPPFHKRNC